MRIIAAFVALFAQVAFAQVHVLASNGVRAVVDDLRHKAEKAVGHPLAIEFNSTNGLKPKLEAGEGYDAAIVTSDMMDELIKGGKIVAGSRMDLARCGIGVGIRAGAAKPDISTGDALKRALLNTKAVSYAQDGASRTAIEKMFERMGIADKMKGKTLMEQGSVRSAGRVTAGDADFVMTLVSEILPIKGIELLGALPSEYQGYVSFSAGVAAKAGNADGAKALVKFLASHENAATYKARGMEPR